MSQRTWIAGALLAALVGASSAAGDGVATPAPDAVEVMQRSQDAFLYAGRDFRARVTMTLVSGSGSPRQRVLTMLRRNDPSGASGRGQRYFLYFHEPGDVRRMAFLVWKYPEKDDDRWIFIPALNMVRRVAAQDSRSSFAGSDFSYEDVSGRDLGADTQTLLRAERLGEAECWVIESVPKNPIDYTRKLSWIDQSTYLPRKEEYYDARGELSRLFTADAIEAVPVAGGSSVPTITRRTMKNLQSGHRTEVVFADVAYDVGLGEEVFTERALTSPPRQWIR